MPLLSLNKVAHSGFETKRRRHQKSKTEVPVAPQKGFMSAKLFLTIIAGDNEGSSSRSLDGLINQVY